MHAFCDYVKKPLTCLFVIYYALFSSSISTADNSIRRSIKYGTLQSFQQSLSPDQLDKTPDYLTPDMSPERLEEVRSYFADRPIVDVSMEMHIPELGWYGTATGKGGLGILECDTAEGYAKLGLPAFIAVPAYETKIVPRSVHPEKNYQRKGQVLDIEKVPYDKLIDTNNIVDSRLFTSDRAQVVNIISQNKEKPIKKVVNADGSQLILPITLFDEWRNCEREYYVGVFVINRGGLPIFLFACKEIFDILYTDHELKRLKQQVLMGHALPALMKALGIKPGILRVNEAHTVVSMAIMKEDPYFDGGGYAFTNHTPKIAGLARYIGKADWFYILKVHSKYKPIFCVNGNLDFSNAALQLADERNGVSARHAQVMEEMFPGFSFRGIMNGSGEYWKGDALQALERSMKNRVLSPSELWAAHQKDKTALIQFVRKRVKDHLGLDIRLNEEEPVLIAIRRITEYKLLYPMLKDIVRAVCQDKGVKTEILLDGQPVIVEGLGINIILGGIIVSEDWKEMQDWIREFISWMKDPAFKGRFVFISGNDIELMRQVAAGADAWSETPRKDEEACGTSGERAFINGNFTLGTDGWTLETIRTYRRKKPGEDVGFGNGFVIEPATPEKYFEGLQLVSDIYYDWIDHGDPEWINLQKKIYDEARAVYVENMVMRYVTEIFIPLRIKKDATLQQVDNDPAALSAA